MLRIMGFDEAHIVTIKTVSFGKFVGSLINVTWRLRRLRLEATINLEVFARFSTLLAWASGAPVRVGFYPFNDQGSYIGTLTTHRVIYNPHFHVAKSYVAFVRALSDPPSAEPAAKVPVEDLAIEPLRIESNDSLSDGVREKVASRLGEPIKGKQIVILNTNVSDLIAVRRWPDDHYVSLARSLLANPDIAIVLTGAPGEAPAVEQLASRIGGANAVSMAGRTSLQELIELFHLADVMVSNDSGPAHIASVTKMRTFVLFGPETPGIFGPIGPNQQAVYLGISCSPCVSPHNQKRSPCTDNRCMKEITVDQVYATVMQALNRAAS